ncbi:Equatorin [Manis pentadactyla]|nr:Equatorin [Manis pentadactyla]
MKDSMDIAHKMIQLENIEGDSICQEKNRLCHAFPETYSPLTPPEDKPDENSMDIIPANEKNADHFKDIKQYMFMTQNPNGTQSEISVKATTDSNFALRNYELITETTTLPTGKALNEDNTEKRNRKATQGPNVPEFWTILAEALNEAGAVDGGKDQLFRSIPSSDLSDTSDSLSPLEALKLKLMLGVSLMTLFLFVLLLAICSAMLYKLKTISSKKCESQYSINPELATLSYFHPLEGVSDTSFSHSAESCTLWSTSSEMRIYDTSSKSRMTDMMICTASNDTGLKYDSDLPERGSSH